MPQDPKHTRRRFRFSLRTLLILTTLIAVVWAMAVQWPTWGIVDSRHTMQNHAGKIRSHTDFIMGFTAPRH